jgi:hypothetical protein
MRHNIKIHTKSLWEEQAIKKETRAKYVLIAFGYNAGITINKIQ